MPSCIVCHLMIDENSNSYFQCNNEHPLHKYCLAEWLLHSQSCPLCSDPYPQSTIVQFKDYMEQKEKERQEALDEELKKESNKKIEGAIKKVILSTMDKRGWILSFPGKFQWFYKMET